MQLTVLIGYPDNIGRRHAFVGHGKGPDKYDKDDKKDILQPIRFQLYYDIVFPAVTVSGKFQVIPIPSHVGPRAEWRLKWVEIESGEEADHDDDLSEEEVQLGGFAGQF